MTRAEIRAALKLLADLERLVNRIIAGMPNLVTLWLCATHLSNYQR